jgi:hypothetical protein
MAFIAEETVAHAANDREAADEEQAVLESATHGEVASGAPGGVAAEMRAEVQAEVCTEMARLTAASRQAAPVQNRADTAASDIWAYVAERGSSEADTEAFFNGPDEDEVDAFFNEPDKDEEDKAFLDNLDDDEDAHAVSDEQRALLVSFESAHRHATA